MHTPGAAPVILSDLWPEQAASCCIEKQTLDVIARTGREGKGRSMEKLDALLDFIEGHIHEEHIRRTERLHLDAMAYLPVPHLPLAMVFPPAPPKFRCRTLCGPPFMVMQPAHFRHRDDGTLIGELYRPTVMCIHGQRQVRAPAVITRNLPPQNTATMPLAEDDHELQALPPNAPDEALRIGILPRTPWGRKYLFHT